MATRDSVRVEFESTMGPGDTGLNPQGDLGGAGRRPGRRDPWGSKAGSLDDQLLSSQGVTIALRLIAPP